MEGKKVGRRGIKGCMKIKLDENTSENQEVEERLEQQRLLTVVRSDLRLDVNK